MIRRVRWFIHSFLEKYKSDFCETWRRCSEVKVIVQGHNRSTENRSPVIARKWFKISSTKLTIRLFRQTVIFARNMISYKVQDGCLPVPGRGLHPLSTFQLLQVPFIYFRQKWTKATENTTEVVVSENSCCKCGLS